MVGKGRSGYVLTGVERASRYLVARTLDASTADATNDRLHHAMKRLPASKRNTLTVDNGREFSHHRELSRRFGLDVYFAHPYRAWERGTNENTNGLLRQYLHKAMSLSDLTDEQLRVYVRQLNNRPRKCLNYQTPAEVLWERPIALTM
jgi:IS30 family transposase